MYKNRLRGDVGRGERARDREASMPKPRRRKSGGRAENETTAEAVVVAAETYLTPARSGHRLMTMVRMHAPRTIAAGDFKAKCLRIMDEVQAKREPIVITKNGRPVAKLVPLDEPSRDPLGCLSGALEILGDVESPIVSAKDWEGIR
jgi:prevent-host-death family protein